MLLKNALILISLLSILSCKKTNTPPTDIAAEGLYFPPTSTTTWATTSTASAGFNAAELTNLTPYLQSKNTKACIILHNGKIVYEQYFDTFTADSLWYWASAGKTLTAMLVGIAQKDGLLNINNATSQYIGTGWTTAPLAKENLITIKNQLSMTTGLDESTNTNDCTLPSCLTYKADAGTRWGYHTGAYTMLDKVIENVSSMSYNAYFQLKIRDKIGMNGAWLKIPNANNIYYSNARSMARYGLLLLAKGKWDNTPILNDDAHFTSLTNTSQSLNKSYGYLTWLNGKESYLFPGFQLIVPQTLVANAPADMYCALGKNDQKIYVLPSKKIVVIRMGNSAGVQQSALSSFDDEFWGRLKLIF